MLLSKLAPAGVTCAMSLGDKNYRDLPPQREFVNSLGVNNLAVLKQIHSCKLFAVQSVCEYKIIGEGDGLITSLKDQALGIFTADCYPVFMAGRTVIAALHCGWRSSLGGIIYRAAAEFLKLGDTPIYAFIGAGISKSAFEVSSDFKDNLEKDEKGLDNRRFLCTIGGNSFFDLKGLICEQLSLCGALNVESFEVCTFGDKAFHSHRRDKTDSRMLGVIFSS